jgi:hypothetical protein
MTGTTEVPSGSTRSAPPTRSTPKDPSPSLARTSTPCWLVHEGEYGPNSKWGATAGLEPEPLLSISETCGATLTGP